MKEFRKFKTEKNVVQNKYDSLNNNNAQNDIAQTIDKYSSLNRDELMQEIVKIVSTQKQNGTFDKQKIEQFMAMASSMLSPEQKKNMQDIIEKM